MAFTFLLHRLQEEISQFVLKHTNMKEVSKGCLVSPALPLYNKITLPDMLDSFIHCFSHLMAINSSNTTMKKTTTTKHAIKEFYKGCGKIVMINARKK